VPKTQEKRKRKCGRVSMVSTAGRRGYRKGLRADTGDRGKKKKGKRASFFLRTPEEEKRGERISKQKNS